MNRLSIHENRKLYLTIFLIFLGFLGFHFMIPLTHAKDDLVLFFEPLHTQYHGNYSAFLTHRYHTWSSRLVIETFTLYSVTHFWFWRLLDALMMTIASILPAFFIRRSPRILDLCCSTALFLCIPLTLFYDTGWIATSTNYLWVYACALLASYSVWQIAQHQVKLPLYLIGLVTSIYATNHEQMLPLFGTYLVLIIAYLLYRSDLAVMQVLPFLGITLINLIVILLAPGNQVRYASEVTQWFADYESLSLFRKLEIGFSSTIRHLFFDQLALPVLLLIILLICLMVKKTLKPIDLIGSVVPLDLSLALAYNLFQIVPETFRTFFYAQFNQYGTTFQFKHPTTWIPDLILFLVVIGVLFSFHRLMITTGQKWLFSLLFSAAIVVRMILAFSPTIWASSGRTYLFTLGLISLLSLALLKKIDNHKIKITLSCSLIGIGSLLFLSNVYILFASV